MRFDKDLFFKNFNREYLLFIDKYYKEYSISYIKSIIKNEIKILQEREQVKQIKERNINYWLIRGWSYEETIIKINEINKNRKKLPKGHSILSIEYWIKKGLSEEESKQKISQIQKERNKKLVKKRKENPENYKPILSPFTKEFWIKKGITDENEIKKMIKSQRKLNIEYWINKGFNEKESEKMVSLYQLENNKKFQKKWKNKKHTYEYKKMYNTNIEYYLDLGYSVEQSEKMLKERQTTFTLEKCMEKYGEKKGKEIYTERQVKWQKSLLENGNLKCGFSKISQELFYEILKYYEYEDMKNIYFATKNMEYFISPKGKKFFVYDFTDLKRNKIIEYNGDEYHANPKMFESNDNPHPFRKEITAQEIWDKDEEKIKTANKKGFDILIIWDSEYRNNKEEIIKKCKEYLGI